ncbi:Oidioi.mRNA.OKI2018_I69.chr1.g238.t1.cds [Oikopleura dioica]|uniref:Oidioi.mRNA.OKI2018_I69.chr1.g238.t1.cds n=1 Tax=Oikopleura dioica TaxID=34765 RepID=A0ABN7SN32_OIKDI|nr:Oidioi.mRNA.OKI2018_I69.chr1.g238.t1.cds [Oikopleura dioica]
MGRIRDKVTPTLRKALEEIGLNVGPPPNPEHPNFMPRWDFSQSTEKITVTIYVKTCDPNLTYAESSGSDLTIFACFGWFKRLVSLKIADFHDEVKIETALLTMSPNKVEVSMKKQTAGEITWPKVHGSSPPELKHEGILNPEPPKPVDISEPIVEEPEDGEDDEPPEMEEDYKTYRTGGIWQPDAQKKSKKESALEKRARYVEQRARGLIPEAGKNTEPDYDSEEEEEIIKAELARLPAEMRARIKVCLKSNEDGDDDDLDGVEQIDWVESKDAKTLMKNSSYVDGQNSDVLNIQ